MSKKHVRTPSDEPAHEVGDGCDGPCRGGSARLAIVLAVSLAVAGLSACDKLEPAAETDTLVDTAESDTPGADVPDVGEPEPVWGIADLHAHPTSFLGFGYDGASGLFHGHPGLALDAADIVADLGTCNPATHAPADDTDTIREQTRDLLVGSSESEAGFVHRAQGAPDFAAWPHARSLLHQQMHVVWLHRAWQGGVRLIVASTVDNQLLSRLYQRGQLDDFPEPTADFDYEAARVQLQHMQDLAAANAEWMAYVTTPAEARAAIGDGKLALVPSLEMDSLTADQILALHDEFGVAHVIPVHLVDNSFGGAAVYEDLFNSNNEYLNGELMEVVGDPLLSARLGHPLVLRQVLVLTLPEKISRAAYCALGYEPCPEQPVADAIPIEHGHRNARGLVDGELERLMEAGLMIDLAHMSEAATEDALGLAEAHCYPMMNSHSGVREAGAHAHDERAMRSDHLERMAALGGLLGFGTAGDPAPSVVAEARPEAPARIDSATPWTLAADGSPVVPLAADTPLNALVTTVVTGPDGLAGDTNNARIQLALRDGRVLRLPLNHAEPWAADSEHTVRHPLTDVTADDLAELRLTTNFGGTLSSDTWDVASVRVAAETDAGEVALAEQAGTPALQLNGGVTDARLAGWRASVGEDGSEDAAADAPVARLRLRLHAHDDGLDESEALALVVTLTDGSEVHFDDLAIGPLDAFSSASIDLPLDAPIGADGIASVTIEATAGGASIAWLQLVALHDPLPRWIEASHALLERMGDPLLTVGTDINGLAPQFALTSGLGDDYEVDAHLAFGAPSDAPVLGPSTLGPRTFDVGPDGLAHYGMVPDVMEALSRVEGSEATLTSIYGSAEATIRMWEASERAARRWPGGCD